MVFAGALTVILFVAPLFFPWSPLNCRHQDIDIKSGRLRFQRYLLFCKVSEQIRESPISEAIGDELADTSNSPEWHRVNTFSPGYGWC